VAICLTVQFAISTGLAAERQSPAMPKVRVSGDGRQFVLGESGKVFVPWGFNYLGEFGKLIGRRAKDPEVVAAFLQGR
jgi:hypothetical protein